MVGRLPRRTSMPAIPARRSACFRECWQPSALHPASAATNRFPAGPWIALWSRLRAGARIKGLHIEQVNGELMGDIEIGHASVRGGVIEKAVTAALIDEIPVLAVLGAASEEGLVIRDARELRIKETDRIATVAENFE